ncbi:hypothetical protein PHYC_02848 [Phycisphaerales bacterium]|nr:hypothetical protein PHYC_02848 [Phycisphaerales bacterium]
MPPTTRDEFAWKSFLSHLSSFGVLVLCLALLTGATLGLRPLEARASGFTVRRSPEVAIRWPMAAGAGENGPTWLPRDEQERLTRLTTDAARDDDAPYTAASLERVSRVLASSGWFEGYPTVRRLSPELLGVSGTWRIPAAVVRSAGQDYLISWDALPLPPVYPPGKSTLPAILDPAKGPPRTATGDREFNTPWQGEDVGAALELIQTITTQPWSDQVAGVDVSKFAMEGSLVLVTRSGNRIVWGGRPTKPRLGEVSTRQKLVHLAQLQHDFKRIDAGYPLIYVNTDRLQFDTSASAQGSVGSGTPHP